MLQNPQFQIQNSSSAWTRPPRILVVDDEHIVADTLARILALHGCDATPVYTASAALDAALDEVPDLLITDVALSPDSINGVDLAIYFEREFPGAPVLLISGHAATANLHAAARAAGHEFPLLAKPIAPAEILRIVDHMLAHLKKEAEQVRQAS